MSNPEWIKEWPADAPSYYNTLSQPCDTWRGPCICGSWHDDGEFELVGETLYRYGKYVAGKAPETYTEISKRLPPIL